MAASSFSAGRLTKFKSPWWKKEAEYSTLEAAEDGGPFSPPEQEFAAQKSQTLTRAQHQVVKLIFATFILMLLLAFGAMFVSQLAANSKRPANETNHEGKPANHERPDNFHHAMGDYGDKESPENYGHESDSGYHRAGMGYDSTDHIPTASSAIPLLKSPCGNNSTTARSAGCHFDIISFAWLHHDCYDPELSKAFASIREWEWFRKPNREEPISAIQALTGDYPVLYVDWEYHVRHCTYMWKKMHRAIIKKGGMKSIDWYIAPFEHTEHCSEMLLARGKGYEFDALNTGIRVKYPDCGIALE